MAEPAEDMLPSLLAPAASPPPEVVVKLAGGIEPQLVWTNELGGLTYRVGERFVKYNPRSTSIDLDREVLRLEWLTKRHPAPRVLEVGADESAQWMVTEALPGDHAVGDHWRERSAEAINAIATGLLALHSVAIHDAPEEWVLDSWVSRTPDGFDARPSIDEPVLLHGDACAPNTLIDSDGRWVGHVDLGDLSVGDRWADLAIASLSLDWNFGDGHQGEFFAAYGVDPDFERIEYYRALWHQES